LASTSKVKLRQKYALSTGKDEMFLITTKFLNYDKITTKIRAI